MFKAITLGDLRKRIDGLPDETLLLLWDEGGMDTNAVNTIEEVFVVPMADCEGTYVAAAPSSPDALKGLLIQYDPIAVL